ncbi:hypothetical protein [Prochlorococcus marinus]|nr:hypothetical protein [Prochlorococcus marinus]
MKSYYACTEEPISKAPANKRIAGRSKRSNSLVASNFGYCVHS